MLCSLRLSVICCIGALVSLCPVWGAQVRIDKTKRGAIVETDRFRVEFRDGVLVGLFNRLTGEAYLDSQADIGAVVSHLPSGLGTQAGEPAREAAERLYHWPWWEHPNDLYLPNQHYADLASKFAFLAKGHQGCVLTYTGLTDGKKRLVDESFSLTLEVDKQTGDLLVTPEGRSPRPGVYSANLTVAPLAPGVAAEAPIVDGIKITRQNTGPVLWTNQWPGYWDYGFIAFDGQKRGAFGIWTQDQKMRYYKHLFYLNNDEGLSFSFSMMNIPPFEALKECRAALPWRIQAFDKSWAQASARYRVWRDANVKMAKRPDYAMHISFMASVVGAEKTWLDHFLDYTRPWQGNAAAFLTNVRKQEFDTNHADNTPRDTFKEDVKLWRAAGTYGMAYLQPMIMWGPFTPEAKRSEREKQALEYHKAANTHSVFQKDPETVVPYVDQHHLGHPQWQRWFLDWVKDYCQIYGAQGIYHDSAYETPVDRRGLSVGGMTSPEGLADYFYKAATENPGTIHGTEKITEPAAVAVSNSIGSGYHWGTAPNMRLTRAYDSSPVTASLSSPYSVQWSFIRLRGDSLWDLRERRMDEARAFIAGAIDGPTQVDPKYFPLLCNVPWYDRTRDETFLKYGLRPYFPEDYSRDVLSYFRGQKGEEFRYEKTTWGSQFVQVEKTGAKKFICGIVCGVQYVPTASAGISGWLVYNDSDPNATWNQTGPSGLNTERFYVLDPTIKRPPVYFSTSQGSGPSFYESSVEDSGYNDYFAFIKLRTIERLTSVSHSESLVLHSPQPPKVIYVNGKKSEFQRQGQTDLYSFSVQIPADIVVILKDPPAAAADLHRAVMLRVTETEHPVDYCRPELLAQESDGGVDAQGRAVLLHRNVPCFGSNFGGRRYLSVPLSAPAGSKAGAVRLHLPATENRDIDQVEVNCQPVAIKGASTPGSLLTIPETIDIPLAPGEVKLVTIRTSSQTPTWYLEYGKPAISISVEWLQ